MITSLECKEDNKCSLCKDFELEVQQMDEKIAKGEMDQFSKEYWVDQWHYTVWEPNHVKDYFESSQFNEKGICTWCGHRKSQHSFTLVIQEYKCNAYDEESCLCGWEQ